MVSEDPNFIIDVRWLSLLPGLVTAAAVLAGKYFGDWMRGTLDPKLRQA